MLQLLRVAQQVAASGPARDRGGGRSSEAQWKGGVGEWVYQRTDCVMLRLVAGMTRE